ncbi:MAG: SCO family protein [Alphaproteobacteria bacterium]
MAIGKNIRLTVSILLLGIAVVGGITIINHPNRDEATSHEAANNLLPTAISFNLIDHHGQAVTEKNWHGKYLLVYFGFTSCPDICPTELNNIGVALEKMTESSADQLQVLFVSVDHARDTPTQMAEFLKAFNTSIVGLTGNQEAIDSLASQLKVYHQLLASNSKNASDNHYEVSHSGFIYLVDTKLNVIKVFSSGTAAEEIAHTIDLAITQ